MCIPVLKYKFNLLNMLIIPVSTRVYVMHSLKGIDFKDMTELASELAQHEDVARRCKILRSLITAYQDSITSLERVSTLHVYLLNL